MDDRDEMLQRLKGKLRATPLSTPAVEMIQPEIRSVAQYAAMSSMRAGFLVDETEQEF